MHLLAIIAATKTAARSKPAYSPENRQIFKNQNLVGQSCRSAQISRQNGSSKILVFVCMPGWKECLSSEALLAKDEGETPSSPNFLPLEVRLYDGQNACHCMARLDKLRNIAILHAMRRGEDAED
ncbi:MAG TPA: hypothetical protein VG347_21180 [Verrucomicrobiae bacterium]|nr:hypothetical protein [Verrucomicrobiae bacterium]